MFSHAQVWSAIDALAERNSISVSRLARNAGLDPTTFNKSKRIGADGRLRWPSTESLSKIMDATGTDLSLFTELVADDKVSFNQRLSALAERTLEFGSGLREAEAPYNMPSAVPLLGLAQAGSGGFFDDAGLPTGEGWDAVDFPQSDGETVYALEISGDSMEPLYRDGDRIIVSPGASVRRGDRVVVRTHEGEVMAKVLARRTAKQIELQSLNPDHENRSFDVTEVDWIARIVWASQ
ncbi:MAG: helix-turn-helix transcriptional regulator [Pseudomonadota bacterium]